MTDPSLTPEQTEQTEPELTEPEQPKRGRKLGSKNLPKIDYDSRIEKLIFAMNVLIEKGELTPTVERAYNRQIEFFQFQIQRKDDAKKESQNRRAELEAKNAEINPQPPVPPVPSIPTPDVETERRINKMLKQLEEMGRSVAETPVPVPEAPAPPLYSRDLAGNLRLNVNRTESKSEPMEPTSIPPAGTLPATKPKPEPKPKLSAEDVAAAEEKQKRIVELKQAREEILKGRHGRAFMLAAVSNPTFLRDGNAALKAIVAELQQLENPNLVKTVKNAGFDSEEYDRRQRALEEQEFTDRLLEGERLSAANRATARPAPISGGLGYCEGPEWNR